MRLGWLGLCLAPLHLAQDHLIRQMLRNAHKRLRKDGNLKWAAFYLAHSVSHLSRRNGLPGLPPGDWQLPPIVPSRGDDLRGDFLGPWGEFDPHPQHNATSVQPG